MSYSPIRLLQQELEDHVNDGLNFEKQKKLMQSEIEELRHRLETETLAKSEEMAARRKISNELKDAIEKYAAETVRSREYADAAESYRIRANELLLQVEQTEVNRMRIEKEVATSRLQIKDLQESIQDVNREKKAAEDRARNLEEQLHEVRELVEERALEAAEAKAAKEKLQSEIRQMHDRLTTESEQRDELVDQMRRKYQKEMQQLNAELETEKSCSLSAREARKQIELEIQNLQAQFDSESRNIGNWRREKERYEQRIDEVSRSLSEALRAQEDAAFQNATTSARIRELQAALDEVEAQKNTLERSKRALEQRVEDFSDQFQEALRTRQALERSLASMETEVTSLRSNLEEQIEVANKATERSHQAQGFNQALQIELDKERESAQELERVKVRPPALPRISWERMTNAVRFYCRACSISRSKSSVAGSLSWRQMPCRMQHAASPGFKLNWK